MFKKLSSYSLLSIVGLISLLSVSNSSHATHSSGMEIFYRWVSTSGSDSTYEFTLIFYRNCQGFTASAPTTASIQAHASSIQGSGFINCSRLPTTGTGVPPLQPPSIYSCMDTTASYCAEEYVYRGQWTSPRRARDWIFYYSLCCIPNTNAPTNMTNGTLYAECGLNNFDFPDHSSKNRSLFFHNRRPNHPGYLNDTVNNPPHISMCESRNVSLNQSVRNYDADSVSYEFMIPKTTPTSNNTYINGWSFANPITSKSGPITIDSLSGMINFIPGTPTGTGIYLLGVKATEYRNDTITSGSTTVIVKKEIGFVTRNLMIFIEDSASCGDGTFAFSDASGPGGEADSIAFPCPYKEFTVYFRDPVLCESVDTNGSCFQIRDAANGKIIPIGSLNSGNCGSNQFSNYVKVRLDTVLGSDTLELVIKQGNDGNTMFTACHREVAAFADTLTIFFREEPTGEFLGDPLTPTTYSPIIELECGETEFDLRFSEQADCGSIDLSGTSFEMIDSQGAFVSIFSTTPVCNGGKTKKVLFKTSALNAGPYLLRSSLSSNLPLETICGAAWPLDSIVVVVDGLNPDLGPDTTYCIEDSSFFMILTPGSFSTYLWQDGSKLGTTFISDTGIYWVRVTNPLGCEETDTIHVTRKKCSVGIDNTSLSQSIRLYPNPTNGEFFIEIMNPSGEEMIEVYNIKGIKVMSMENKQSLGLLQLNLIGQNEGIYFVQVLKDGVVLSQEKLVYKDN